MHDAECSHHNWISKYVLENLKPKDDNGMGRCPICAHATGLRKGYTDALKIVESEGKVLNISGNALASLLSTLYGSIPPDPTH